MRLNTNRAIVLALMFGFAAAVPAEQIHKCTGDDGKVVYQKQPCEKQQIEEKKDINPDRNAVKMELPPPSEAPKAAAPTSTPATPAPAPTIIRRRSSY
jgi:hypothetical protein